MTKDYKIFIDAKLFKTTEAEFNRAMDFIQQMKENEVLQIFGEETDSDFFNTILNVFERFRNKYHLCLITPDESLAREILKLLGGGRDEIFSQHRADYGARA